MQLINPMPRSNRNVAGSGLWPVLAFLFLAAACAPLHAQDVAELKARVAAKQTEIDSLADALGAQQQAAEDRAAELEALRARSDGLEQAEVQAREAMDAQYERIVADPSLTLTEAQAAYRAAMAAVQDHRAATAAKEQEIAAQQQQIAQTEADAETAAARLGELRLSYDAARVARLQRELNSTDEIVVENAITCRPDETISGCIERGEAKARNAALAAFVERLIAASTEAEAVAARAAEVELDTTMAEGDVVKSGFQGQGDYFVELKARVSNRVGQSQACALLGLEGERCNSPAAIAAASVEGAEQARPASAGSASAEQPAAVGSGSHLLTVRSNVRLDEVFINGIAYGSTRLDVELPAGEYEVEVRKPGYSTHVERVTLSDAATVSAQLSEL